MGRYHTQWQNSALYISRRYSDIQAVLQRNSPRSFPSFPWCSLSRFPAFMDDNTRTSRTTEVSETLSEEDIDGMTLSAYFSNLNRKEGRGGYSADVSLEDIVLFEPYSSQLWETNGTEIFKHFIILNCLIGRMQNICQMCIRARGGRPILADSYLSLFRSERVFFATALRSFFPFPCFSLPCGNICIIFHNKDSSKPLLNMYCASFL